MSNQWVNFAAIKESVDIEQVLVHYGVRLKRVRKDYLRGLCRCQHTAPNRAGELWRGHQQERVGLSFSFLLSGTPRQSGWEYSGPGGGYGGLLDPRGGVAAESLERRSRKPDFPINWFQKGKRAGSIQEEPRRLSFTLRLQWHPYLEQRNPAANRRRFGVGYYAGSDSWGDASCFRFTMRVANWWRMRAA